MVLSKVTVLLAVAVGCAEAAVVSRISPELEHDSAGKFDKDYPLDLRPKAGKEYAFGHPYPVVQDSGSFAADFVKDENSDNGSWQAQMEYDTLRAKMRKQMKQADEALKHKERELKELEQMRTDEKHAEEKSAKARDNAAKAKADADKAAKDVADLEGAEAQGGGKGGGSDSKLDQATAKVRKETSDLEKCKKELEDAKNKLEQLVKEKEDLEKREEADSKKADEFRAGAYVAAKTLAASEAKDLKDAKAKEDKLEKEEAHLKKEMLEEQKEHAEAKTHYEEEKVKVEKTKADLERAEAKLKGLRGEPLPRSPAMRPVAAFMVAMAAVVCIFAH